MIAAVILALVADVSPPRAADPRIDVERLGTAFSKVGEGMEHGLAVQTWRNESLKREESWTSNEVGEWFLKARDGVYVLAASGEDGWVTVPSERLVWRGGAWKRITVR